MGIIRRTLVALLAISSVQDQNMAVKAAYENGMNAGMALRLEQKTIESWKRAM